MSPASIPEGFVFVPREPGVNVALELLDAAKKVGADRVTSVRTTSGGYHVLEAVADQYQHDFVDTDEDEDETEGEESAPATPVEESAPATPEGAGNDDTTPNITDNLIDDRDAEKGQEEEEEIEVPGPDADSTEGDEEDEKGEEELAPLPVTAESTNAEIDAYAAGLKPPVDVSKAKNRAEKIDILEHARTAPKTDAE